MKKGNMVAFHKKIDKFLWNTENLSAILWNTENIAAILYKYIICHIKYIYDIGKNHRTGSILFYIWNWLGMGMADLNQERIYMYQAVE